MNSSEPPLLRLDSTITGVTRQRPGPDPCRTSQPANTGSSGNLCPSASPRHPARACRGPRSPTRGRRGSTPKAAGDGRCPSGRHDAPCGRGSSPRRSSRTARRRSSPREGGRVRLDERRVALDIDQDVAEHMAGQALRVCDALAMLSTYSLAGPSQIPRGPRRHPADSTRATSRHRPGPPSAGSASAPR